MSDGELPESESILPEEEELSGSVAFPQSPTGWTFWFPSPDRMTMMMVDYNSQFTPLPPSPPPLSDPLWDFSDHSLPSTPTIDVIKQKIVIKLLIRCGKCLINGLLIAAKTSGVISNELQEGKNQIMVIGDGVDAIALMRSIMKKIKYASLEMVQQLERNYVRKSFGEEIDIREATLEVTTTAAAAKGQDSRERPFQICASGDKSFNSEDHQVYNVPTKNNEAAGNIDDENHGPRRKQKLHATTSDGRNVSSLAQALDATTATVGQQNKGKAELNTLRKGGENITLADIDDKNHGPRKKQKLHATTSDGRNVSSLAQALDTTTATVGQQNKGNTELNTLRKSGENITLADIEPLRGETLPTAARRLGVSRSTLKRWCRQLGILNWRSIKINKGEHCGEILNLPITTKQEIPSSTQRGILYDGSRHGYVTVKATYQGDTIKFVLPVSSKMGDLVCEVKQRMNLEVGEFRIKYKDEDDDLITVTCDDDWKLCMCTMGSQANIKMLIEPSND